MARNIGINSIGGHSRLDFPLDVDISLASAGDMGPSSRENPRRDLWLQSVGCDPQRTVLRRQVHSRLVAESDLSNGSPGEADGMVTDDASLALAVTVADCMPVFMFDAEHGAFAALHSGWKGTGIALVALDIMQRRWRTRSQSVSVLLGPCIGPCCYPVDEPRACLFAAEWGEQAVVRYSDRVPRLDLRAANLSMLESRGVNDITVVSDCTGCTAELGSYRRQGPDTFVRMLAVIRGATHRLAS